MQAKQSIDPTSCTDYRRDLGIGSSEVGTGQFTGYRRTWEAVLPIYQARCRSALCSLLGWMDISPLARGAQQLYQKLG